MTKLLSRAALVTAAVLGTLVVPWSAVPASADNLCGGKMPTGRSVLRPVPWQQQWLDPERLWPFATGAGQTVAVIDTGVDGTHPQLTGSVLPGWDLLRNAADSNLDCAGRGTAAASLIAARKTDDTGFHGLAPDAKILPIRVSDAEQTVGPSGAAAPTPAQIGQAIEWATTHGATVISVSPISLVDDPTLKAAVAHALSAGITVVAAVGEERNQDLSEDAPTYPAAYDGVIGVGGVTTDFTRTTKSTLNRYVKLMGPGDAVVVASQVSGHLTLGGTSLAAATVAATAALVRQAWPKLKVDAVASRIIATASPAPGGQLSFDSGRGLVDPYRALTEQVTNVTPQSIAGVNPSPVDTAAVALAKHWSKLRGTAFAIAGGVAILTIMIVVLALVRGAGRRQGWRPRRSRVVEETATGTTAHDDAESSDPDDGLFAVPKPYASAKG